MKNSVVAVAAVAAALFIPLKAAAQKDFICNGSFSGATYRNVVVPAGNSCTLEDTKVTGDVTVEKGASLEVDTNTLLDTTIAGNVTGDECAFIELQTPISPGRIVVGGDLSITDCTGIFFSGVFGSSSSSTITPPTVLIGGNVKCENNTAAACAFDFTAIGGQVECSGSSACELQGAAIGKGATINNNTFATFNSNAVGGDLNCAGNGGVVGTGNTIAGTKSGQCSGL